MSKTYNSDLQTNNTNLQAILNTINALPEAGSDTQAVPVITVNTNGLITATAGTKSTTKQLTTQAATTITPSTLDQIAINSGVYATGNITVKGDSNLVAENIVSGKSIFGVSGTASSGGNTDVEDSLIKGTITNYSNDRVTSIGSYAFYKYSSLTTVSFPACTSIGDYAFAYCCSLATISFPACTSIGDGAFSRCYSFATISFPACTSIGDDAFFYCYNLATANFPVCTSIGDCAFQYCSKISSLTLGASIVCTLAHSNAFYSTPFAGYSAYFSGTPIIYVPASLLASYKTATNWTYFSKYMQAMPEDGGDSGSGATLIDFTIDDKSYQAEENMAWGEWINSDYNTDGFYLASDGLINNPNGMFVCSTSFITPGASDLIIAGAVYMLLE